MSALRTATRMLIYQGELEQVDGSYGIEMVVPSPTGAYLLATGYKAFTMYDRSHNVLDFVEDAHPYSIAGASWAHDGSKFALHGRRSGIGVWDANGNLLEKVVNTHHNWVEHIAWAPHKPWLLTIGGHSKMSMWVHDGASLTFGKQVQGDANCDVCWAPDGSKLAVLGGSHFTMWSPELERIQTIQMGDLDHRHLKWAPDGSRIITAGWTNWALWSKDGIPLKSINGAHTDHIGSIAWAPDSKHFATVSKDRSIAVWTQDGTQVCRTEKAHPFYGWDIVWTRDNTLLTVSADCRAHVWTLSG